MAKTDFIKAFLADAEGNQLKRSLRGVQPISARECVVNGKTCLNFSANDYLGLSFHPLVLERAIEWTEKYGTGSGASRLVTGSLEAYMELERKIARWKGHQDALLFGSGYMANVGVISALADRNSIIFADKLNHASLNAGCTLSGAKFVRYRHNDMDHLQKQLERFADAPRKLVVSDTVFSMDGDVPPLDEIKDLSAAAEALLYLDDAHATGVIGDCGKGLAHGPATDLAMGTFSKAMGSYGAYVACSSEVKEYLVNRSGSFIYTTALPPAVCGAIDAALDLVQSDEFSVIRETFHKRCLKVRNQLKTMGYDTGQSTTQIIPIILGDASTVMDISNGLVDLGLLVVAIRPPTVPKGTARLRLSLNAAHTDADLERLLEALAQVSTKSGWKLQ